MSSRLLFLAEFLESGIGAQRVPDRIQAQVAIAWTARRFAQSINCTFFADGVQNESLTALAKIADLKVISRASVLAYKAGNPRNLRKIAQQPGVAHVLEGSVQRLRGKVGVNVTLSGSLGCSR